jgi:hypothetical protein
MGPKELKTGALAVDVGKESWLGPWDLTQAGDGGAEVRSM